MLASAIENNIRAIAIPKIGAGLGEMNWGEVKQVLEECLQEYAAIELVVVENHHPSHYIIKST